MKRSYLQVANIVQPQTDRGLSGRAVISDLSGSFPLLSYSARLCCTKGITLYLSYFQPNILYNSSSKFVSKTADLVRFDIPMAFHCVCMGVIVSSMSDA